MATFGTDSSTQHADQIALAGLKLADADLACVRRSGLVRFVPRGRRGGSYRLCFRREGKQVSIYLGVNRERSQAVEAELARLRGPRDFARQAAEHVRELRQLERQLKKPLVALLARDHLYLHGRRVRRRRTAKTNLKP